MDKWDTLRLDSVDSNNWEDRLMMEPLDVVLDLYAVPTEEVRYPIISGIAADWYKIKVENHPAGLIAALQEIERKALLNLVETASAAHCVLLASYEPKSSVEFFFKAPAELHYLCVTRSTATGIAPLSYHKGDSQ